MTMTMTMSPGAVARPEQEDAHVVRRQVPIPWPSVAERLRAAGLASPCEIVVTNRRSVHLDGFRSSASEPQAWRATAHLQWKGGRLRRRVRVPVEVWIEAWSDRSSHLQLLPHALLVDRWGTRRRRRYFEVAHAAADQLLLLLH